MFLKINSYCKHKHKFEVNTDSNEFCIQNTELLQFDKEIIFTCRFGSTGVVKIHQKNYSRVN